jgi:transposase
MMEGDAVKKAKKIAKLPIINPNAAGIDIGATQIFVAVPPDRDAESVRCFGTFTADLEKRVRHRGEMSHPS